MNRRPVYNEDGTTGERRTKHSRDGGKGYGTNMLNRRREKRMGRGEKRDIGRMELNIGVESGRYRKSIYRLRTFCKWGLDEYSLPGMSKPQKWVPQDPCGLHPRKRSYYLTLFYLTLVTGGV
eukprot:2005569-Pleurochrysis_carterae.AAC.2